MEFTNGLKNINLNSKNPIWGVLLILAGLVVGWLAWGGNDVRIWNRHHDAHMEETMPVAETVQTGKDDALVVTETDMMHTMDAMTAGLAGKEGHAFDEAFLDEMIVHHEGAVAMAKLVLEKSDRPELLKLAGEIIYAQTKEIQMMKEWKKKWF